MKYFAYTIHDNKALTYSPPFFAVTDGAAVRIVQDTVNDLNTSLGRHPADYVLYRIGGFNDENGAIFQETPLMHIIDLVALVHTIKPTSTLFDKE